MLVSEVLASVASSDFVALALTLADKLDLDQLNYVIGYFNTKKDSLLVSRKDTKTFQCDQCQKIFTRNFCLKRHLETHSELPSKEKCTTCDINVKNLYQHNRLVHGAKKFACDQCEYKTTGTRDLGRHVKAVHDKLKRVCPECGLLIAAEHLRAHLKTAHGPRNLSCDLCQKLFATKDDLKRHRRTHQRNEKKN